MNITQVNDTNHQQRDGSVYNMQFLVWNVQGAGSREVLNMLREHIHMYKPCIVALVETRISGSRAQLVCDRIGFRNCFRVEAQGFQGGIWVLWNSEETKIEVITSHEQFVTVEVKSFDHGNWLLTFVYASPQVQTREILWQTIQQLAPSYRKPWLLAGDFNETICLEERSHGGPDMVRRCRRFKNWIDNNGFIDLGFSGPQFTWARGRSLATRREARLDRALCNIEWRLKFPNGAVRHLLQACSDHSPLLISTRGFPRTERALRPFRFQAAWLSHEQFDKVVEENWRTHAPLMPKLSQLASNLSTWNKDVFGNLFKRKRTLWARIEGIQRRLTMGAPRHLLKLERKLRLELNQTLAQIAMLWFQKSREDRIRDGDRNTKYFHTATIIRRRFNHVHAIKDGAGEWRTDPNEIKQLFVAHFRALFSEENTGQAVLRSNSVAVAFPELPQPLLQSLEEPFTKQDIHSALRGMQPFKAPGPDGFHALFFQRFWHIVEDDVCQVVLKVLNGHPMPNGLNDTFITLIPKIPNPEQVTQFRPIGLCNVVYKVITKCIVNKLKRVLPVLISPYQSSFVPGRRITDNVIVMQEILHSMRRKSGSVGWMAIKLDLEKAYDRLRWGFIHETLLKMHLPRLLVEVIMNCVSSSTLNILWNGEPSEKFRPSRGVRQGDPLSPYLFVACLEHLSQLIEASCIEGEWRAIPITRGGTRLSHLMFADDVVLLGEATKEQAHAIKACLQTFCMASGQKVSMAKSSVYFSPNTNDGVKAEISVILGFQQTMDFGRYLGVPSMNGRVSSSLFQNVIERVDSKLAGWKAKCLSLAGRHTLIQASITAIPAYVMQSTRIPRSVCDELDKRIRRFLWGGTAMDRKPHLVPWDKVIKEKVHGGLGIRSMRQLNSAFLMKLGWRLRSEPEAIWARILREKYSKGRDLDSLPDRIGSCSNAWRGLLETLEPTKQGLGVAIGDGRQTEFWNHKWLDGKLLREHALCPIPEAQSHFRVCDYWEPRRGWDWSKLSHTLPPEILQRITSFELPSEEIGDRHLWLASKNGRFSIKFAISILQPIESTGEDRWSWIWRIPLPYRIQMFIWLLQHQKLMTNAERFRRKLSPTPQCDICCEGVEDLDHLLRQCLSGKEVWLDLQRKGISYSFAQEEFKDWLQKNLAGTHVDPNWPTKFAITLWFIWKWRCAACFGNTEKIPTEKGLFLCDKFQEIS